MASLVSPGVSVTVSEDIQYSTSPAGTVPLIVLATAANKFQSGSTALASGTVPGASQLTLITSQRDALQTFGSPTFYSSGGTPQYNNELNEFGLLALYQYLGISNSAYVLRAGIDLGQLAPSNTAPTGSVTNGTYWLNTVSSSYGLFVSNGNPNPALAWQAETPKVITSSANLETWVQGNASTNITSSTSAIITNAGNLTINNTSIALTTSDSLTSIASKINSNSTLSGLGITATIFAITGKYVSTSSSVGDIYSLRIVVPGNGTTISLTGSTPSVLTNLGFSASPTNHVAPASSFGNSGDFAIDVVTVDSGGVAPSNRVWEKITLTTSFATTAWWFYVGSNSVSNPGFNWTQAVPTVVTGNVSNPTFTAGDSFNIQFGSGNVLTVTVPSTPTLANLVAAANTVFNGAGVNAVASVYTVGTSNYLQITNYDGTSIWMRDNDTQAYSHHPLRNAGIFATQTYFSSVTGSVSNPSYVSALLNVASATVSATGTGYAINDVLTVSGGTSVASAALTVSALQAVSANETGGGASGGSGYAVNDTLTFGGPAFSTPVIATVQGISGGAITNLAIIQPGVLTGTLPSNPVTATATSGSGTGAAINLVWGVQSVTVSSGGDYSALPTSPASVTGGSGSGATFSLTPGFFSSNSFTINAGAGAVTVNVPAAPNNTVSGVAAART